jgi:TPR repeat protein
MTLDELLVAANRGNPEAQYVVGLCYLNGWGVVSDKGVAENWFLKSAQAGFAASQYQMSLLLQTTDEDDLRDAIDWLRKSALQGFSLAQDLYSQYCEGGIGMARDPVEAFRFCLLVAKGDYYPAAKRAASMLEQGIGVDKNLEQAFQWYYRAAELGDVDSAASVGRMYATGTGVEKNDTKALEWLQEGQKRGSPWALFALSSAYRFGELGLSIDLRKADELGLRAQELLEERAALGRSHLHTQK